MPNLVHSSFLDAWKQDLLTLSSAKKVGFIDSGLGGVASLLSFLHIRETHSLAVESIYYYADSAFFPYGTKDASTLEKRFFHLLSQMEQREVEFVIIACNTLYAILKDLIQERKKHLPIILLDVIEPTCAYIASHIPSSSRIVVLETPNSAQSAIYTQILKQIDTQEALASREVLEIAFPHLANCVEKASLAGCFETQVVPVLDPLLHPEDTIILGCTHYHFLMPFFHQRYAQRVISSASVLWSLYKDFDLSLPNGEGNPMSDSGKFPYLEFIVSKKSVHLDFFFSKFFQEFQIILDDSVEEA